MLNRHEMPRLRGGAAGADICYAFEGKRNSGGTAAVGRITVSGTFGSSDPLYPHARFAADTASPDCAHDMAAGAVLRVPAQLRLPPNWGWRVGQPTDLTASAANRFRRVRIKGVGVAIRVQATPGLPSQSPRGQSHLPGQYSRASANTSSAAEPGLDLLFARQQYGVRSWLIV